MKEWYIRSSSDSCIHNQNGRCFRALKYADRYTPPWCEEKICKIKC